MKSAKVGWPRSWCGATRRSMTTLRIVDDIAERGVLAPEVTVIPGVTSISALTAAHRIPLHRIGEPIHITGRLLASTPEGAAANQW